MAANIFADVKAYLMADEAIRAVVGDRIYNGDFAVAAGRAGGRASPKALVIRGVGGLTPTDPLTPFGEGRIDVYAYAQSYDDAQEIDLLVYDRLEGMNGYGSVNYIDPSSWSYTTEDERGRRGMFRSYIVHTFRYGRAEIGD